MPGDQPMKHVDDEERDEKGLGRLARQNNQGAVEQLSINFGKRCLDIQHADLTFGPLYDVVERILPGYDRANATLANGDMDRIRSIGDLAYLDGLTSGRRRIPLSCSSNWF
jgi:hypothetical protein